MPKRPTFRLFELHYTKNYIPGPFAQPILSETRGISIRPRILHNYKTRDRTGLWISIMGNSTAVKRVVRNKVTRKVRQAFTDALAGKGYAADGTSPQGSLSGSIEFRRLRFEQVLQSPGELEGEMEKLVKWLGEGQRRGSRHGVEIMQARETGRQDDKNGSDLKKHDLKRGDCLSGTPQAT